MAYIRSTLRPRRLVLSARLAVVLATLALAALAAAPAPDPSSALAKKSSAQSAGKHGKDADRKPREAKGPKPAPNGGKPGENPGKDPGDGDPPAATPSKNPPAGKPRKPSGNGLQPLKGRLRPIVRLRRTAAGVDTRKRSVSRRSRPGNLAPSATNGGVRGTSARGSTSGAEPPVSRDAGAGGAGAATAPDRGPTAATRPDKDESDASAGTPLSRTVRDIVEVVPRPLKVALAALAALSVMLTAGSIFTTVRARRLDRQRAQLLHEVGLLQAALLPPVPETVGGLRTSVAYRPAEGLAAGGDFYDALTLSGGRAAFILGDVSGHGRQALARTAFMRYTLRAYLEAGLEPRVALQVAGRVIEDNLDGDFATVVLAVHDPERGSLTYACAGHPAPIVVTPDPFEPVLAASSPPIGTGLRTGLRQTTVPLPPGSAACFFTDGLAEARTDAGVLGRPRLGDLVQGLQPDGGAQDLLDRVAAEARTTPDDMAAVLVRPATDITAGGFRSEQLELDEGDLEAGLGERFLNACEVDPDEIEAAAREAKAAVRDFGGAILHVVFGIRGPHVDVLPRNVESLQAASLSAAAVV